MRKFETGRRKKHATKGILLFLLSFSVFLSSFVLCGVNSEAKTKRVNKVLCKDKNIVVTMKSIKNGKIILSVKPKKDGDIKALYLSFGGKTYYEDYFSTTEIYSGVSRDITIKMIDDNFKNVKYQFNGGKIKGKFCYSVYTDSSHTTYKSYYMKPFNKTI